MGLKFFEGLKQEQFYSDNPWSVVGVVCFCLQTSKSCSSD